MEPVSTRYRDTIRKMIAASKGAASVSVDQVFQRGNIALLPFIDSIIVENLRPGSGFRSFDNLRSLHALAAGGAKCLLLVEHYSNFDLPAFSYLLRNSGPEGAKLADDIVAIAGIKLSETNPVVSSFTEAYSRLVIYPSRAIDEIRNKVADPEVQAAEISKANQINLASMKELARLRASGKLILVFPSGTRFRPWDPSSKRGVREIDSYLRSFDYMSFVSINGNILQINPDGEMHEDLVDQDRIVFEISKPEECAAFREKVKATVSGDDDKKQAVVDAVMARLEAMHLEVEASGRRLA